MTTEEKLKEMLGDYYEMGVPGSPNAAILQNILGADNELRDPQSENEALLKLIYEDGQLINQEAIERCEAAQEASEQTLETVQEVYDSIPADYSALSLRVDGITSVIEERTDKAQITFPAPTKAVDIILNGPASGLYDGMAVIDGENIKVSNTNGQTGNLNAFLISAGQVNKANGIDNFIADNFYGGAITKPSGAEGIYGRANSSALEITLLNTRCEYTPAAANTWLQSHPIRIWFKTPDNALATEFYHIIKSAFTGGVKNIGTTDAIAPIAAGDEISFGEGKATISGTSEIVGISEKITNIPEGATVTGAGSLTLVSLINVSGELDEKVNVGGWNEVVPKNTTFFDGINYFDSYTAQLITGVFVTLSGGISTSEGAKSIVLPVKPSTEYVLYIPDNNRGIIVENTESIFVLGETYTTIFTSGAKPNGYNFTTGSTAKYIMVYFCNGAYDYSAKKSGFRLVEGSTLPSYTKPTVKKENLPQDIVNGVTPLQNTKILIFGDSITDTCNLTINESDETSAYSWKNPSNSYTDGGGTTIYYNMWPKMLNDLGTCLEIRNYARSGASYKDATREPGEERQNVSYQITVALNDLDNPNNVFGVDDFVPDIVIFALGTNDGAPNDTPEAAMSKTVLKSDNATIDIEATLAALDTSKFCEAARKAFLRCRAAFPYAQFFCVLPIQRANSEINGGALNTYLKQMAQRYGCVIIDGYSESGIIRDTNVWNGLGDSLKDGLHPNDKGQNMMFRMIYSALRSHYITSDVMNA